MSDCSTIKEVLSDIIENDAKKISEVRKDSAIHKFLKETDEVVEILTDAIEPGIIIEEDELDFL